MQHSVEPELAHTRTTPLHWLAVAAALCAVISLSSVFQPDEAGATPHPAPAPSPSSHAAARPVPAPDASLATYPLTCPAPPGEKAEPPTLAVHVAGDLDGDGSPETVALVHCAAGSGNPPEGLYVLTRTAARKTPRVVATLLDPAEQRTVEDLAIRRGQVRASVLGYSSLDVPRCCPDVHQATAWTWHGKSFTRSSPGAPAGDGLA
ncbi:hypothetical protein [Streptomyces sp. NRRL F-5630]|uniref:hypothetical protein n=1 Tax=Streptomyces sp. NRRL F-5630 TaxID=1463864 RepID=UPI0004CAF877|nr:hypothetical protein [Streptomyces sp. NRRL F-5630]